MVLPTAKSIEAPEGRSVRRARVQLPWHSRAVQEYSTDVRAKMPGTGTGVSK